MHNKSWDDLRYVLSVIKTGTVSGAAREMNVNHATVLRRISAFETRHNVRIFNKSAQGYEVLPENLRLVDALRGVEEAIKFAEASLAGQHSTLQGRLRVTSTDTMCNFLLPDVIARVSAELPEIHVTLVTTNTRLDLGRSQVDLAVRASLQLPDELFGEKVGLMRFGLYGRPDGRDQWIGLTGDVAKAGVARFYLDFIGPQPLAVKADSFLIAARLAAAGMGRALLPSFVAERYPVLEPIPAPFECIPAPIWVVCHADMVNVPRVRALQQKLTEEMRRELKTLS